MNLYLISQRANTGYDTYDSAVVAAETEEQARNTPPSSFPDFQREDWANGVRPHDWCLPSEVDVALIGTAELGTSAGVILASFNAG